MLQDTDIAEAEYEFGVKLPDSYDRNAGCGCPECYPKEWIAMRDYLENLAMEQDDASRN